MISFLEVLIILVVFVVSIFISFSIGFKYALKIRQLKTTDDNKERSKIQMLLDSIGDFVDARVIKPSKDEDKPAKINKVEVSGKQYDERKFLA